MRQTPDTWQEMWEVVGEAMGTEWSTDACLKTWEEVGFDPKEIPNPNIAGYGVVFSLILANFVSIFVAGYYLFMTKLNDPRVNGFDLWLRKCLIYFELLDEIPSADPTELLKKKKITTSRTSRLVCLFQSTFFAANTKGTFHSISNNILGENPIGVRDRGCTMPLVILQGNPIWNKSRTQPAHYQLGETPRNFGEQHVLWMFWNMCVMLLNYGPILMIIWKGLYYRFMKGPSDSVPTKTSAVLTIESDGEIKVLITSSTAASKPSNFVRVRNRISSLARAIKNYIWGSRSLKMTVDLMFFVMNCYYYVNDRKEGQERMGEIGKMEENRWSFAQVVPLLVVLPILSALVCFWDIDCDSNHADRQLDSTDYNFMLEDHQQEGSSRRSLDSQNLTAEIRSQPNAHLRSSSATKTSRKHSTSQILSRFITLNLKMLEARLEQADLLKKVVDAIKDLVQDCNFDCNDSGVALQAMDNSHVALVSMMLKAESFSPYRCDRNVALGVNLTSLTKVLRAAQNEDILTIKAEDAPDVLNLVFESSESDRLSEYDLKLMDIDQEHLGIPDTEYAATITMPSSEFKRICMDLMALSESVSIEASKDGVKFTCAGDIGNGAVTLRSHTNVDKPELNVDIELTEPVSLTFSLKYLVNFCKAAGLSKTVKLCLSNEVPLLVEYGLAASSYLRFYLAPKIGDEE
ncbi:hypothetical protein G7Y89_g9010 [Cudoniella acicularis]|uniref:DNA sliding clamp PCNA n=1 Tax=Cudoniella acicularis TaxID=354080 RepID=A0A8H4RJ77_9HELO|nr:hypothetical protein G7Y89_g9010 [Cudoniella acicularis]